MTDRERDIMEALTACGWVVDDPWAAERDNGALVTWSSGAACPVCGRYAPHTDQAWPPGKTFAEPGNHDADCAYALLVLEHLEAELRKAATE